MIVVDASVLRCPKCQTHRSDGAEECVRCGIIFAKYKPLTAKARPSPSSPTFTDTKWFRTAKQWLIESDQTNESMTFYGRAVVFAAMVWWGWKFIVTPLETNYTGESFLHLINLPFHEAGHVIFMPFGRFMTILGGTLGQILMPLICLGTFLVKTRDPFGGAVALWWTAESLMDIAPYINDARALDLMLIGGVTGKETDGHDWNNILSMLNLLEQDHRLAHLTHNIGLVMMLASFLWGGALLLRHYHRLWE
ncbi:MAG: hypothetical protein JSR29_01720 [Nitrospira sp.]|nr:hypothetical protein [Nitrospira sp.]